MIKAIADRVFVRLEPAFSQSSLILDDSSCQRNIGWVESKGERVSSVNVGDKVLFHIFDELPTPDKDVVVVRENSILGVINDE